MDDIIKKLDLYELLGVQVDATLGEVSLRFGRSVPRVPLTRISLDQLTDPVSRCPGTDHVHLQIKKSYRKKALKCHPDKCPDDPKAAEAFRQLQKALEILSDEVARVSPKAELGPSRWP